MKEIPWTRKPAFFFCPACGRWIDDSVVSGDQVHDRSQGGCGEFVLTRADANTIYGHGNGQSQNEDR